MSKNKKCVKCGNGNLIAPILVGAAAGGFGYGIVSVLSGDGLLGGGQSTLLAGGNLGPRDASSSDGLLVGINIMEKDSTLYVDVDDPVGTRYQNSYSDEQRESWTGVVTGFSGF